MQNEECRMHNVVIRPMEPSDADEKGYVHWKSCLETYTGLMDPKFLEWQSLERCRAFARRWPENTLVAELDGRIVGFGCWDPSGEISALYVLRSAQGFGIGRRLTEALLERLGPCDQVRLDVLEGNDRAIGFYRHMGFRFTGEQTMTRYSATHPALRMVLDR